MINKHILLHNTDILEPAIPTVLGRKIGITNPILPLPIKALQCITIESIWIFSTYSNFTSFGACFFNSFALYLCVSMSIHEFRTLSKQCLCNTDAKTTHPVLDGMGGFFRLLRLHPNPRRTLFCVLKTLEFSSGYAILQITI